MSGNTIGEGLFEIYHLLKMLILSIENALNKNTVRCERTSGTISNYVVHFRLHQARHQECDSDKKLNSTSSVNIFFALLQAFDSLVDTLSYMLTLNALNARSQLKLYTEHSFMPIKWFHGMRLSVHGCLCVSYGLDFVYFFFISTLFFSRLLVPLVAFMANGLQLFEKCIKLSVFVSYYAYTRIRLRIHIHMIKLSLLTHVCIVLALAKND